LGNLSGNGEVVGMRFLSLAVGFVALTLFVSTDSDGAFALGVTPLVVELSSGPSNRTAQIIVRNEDATPKAIELGVYRVDINEDGEPHLTPAPADFVIFPPSRMINPLGLQVFKIQWAGAPLAKSQTYIFQVEHLAVRIPGDTSGIQVIFNFDVIVNVAPPSGTRSLNVLSSGIIAEGNKRFVSLLLGNTGNVHARLSEATVTLRSGSWSKVLSAGDLLQLVGVAVVQPGKKRRFKIRQELPQELATITAEISYEKAFR
jgi:fimbrial chaperone protein